MDCFASADISLTCHHYKPVTDFLYIVSLTALLYNESMTMMDVAIRQWTVDTVVEMNTSSCLSIRSIQSIAILESSR